MPTVSKEELVEGFRVQTIQEAALRVVSRRGLAAATMQEIAAEAGVAKGTIYLYFKSKEDVGLSSIGRVVDAVYERLKIIAESGREPEEKLRMMLIERVMGRIDQIKGYYHSLDELFEVVRPAYMARRKAVFDREVQLIAG